MMFSSQGNQTSESTESSTSTEPIRHVSLQPKRRLEKGFSSMNIETHANLKQASTPSWWHGGRRNLSFCAAVGAAGLVILAILLFLEVFTRNKSLLGSLPSDKSVANNLTPTNRDEVDDEGKDTTEQEVKRSEAWHRLVDTQVTVHLNQNVTPCDDFYEYACGSWIRSTDLPPEKPSITKSFTYMMDRNRILLNETLNEEWPLLGEFYQSCLNESAIEQLGVQPIQELLTSIDAIQTKRQCIQVGSELGKIGVIFLTNVGVSVDFKDATKHTLYVDQPDLTLPDREYYLNATKFKIYESDYREYVQSLFRSLGYNQSKATLHAEEVMNFEKQLAQIILPLEKLRDPEKLYNPMTMNETNRFAPNLISEYITQQGIALTQKGKDNSLPFIVRTPEYFIQAEQLFQSTSVATLKTMLQYLVIHTFRLSLPKAFRDASFQFFGKKLSGLIQRKERWKICVDATISYLGELSSRYYVLKAFAGKEHAPNMARDLVFEIESAMNARFTRVDWMDDDTRRKARDKLGMISNLVGSPKKKENWSSVVLHADAYHMNQIALLEMEYQRTMEKLTKAVDREEWFMFASDVNAYYSPSRNQIVFPAGILQSPFFDAANPSVMNYGAIGFVIGHEITHGFDDSGRKYDGFGNLNSWWSNRTTDEFNRKSKCMEEQYASFLVHGIHGKYVGKVNGKLTLGENIADNGGLDLAYAAYVSHRNKNPQPKMLGKSVQFTDDQLFFVSFAQAWCSKQNEQAAEMSLLRDPHAPPKWRINGAVMNSQVFSKVFKCSLQQAMNPNGPCLACAAISAVEDFIFSVTNQEEAHLGKHLTSR